MNKPDDQSQGFFIMYGESIKALQDELVAIMGVALAKSIMFRFGFKCGNMSAREMNIKGQGAQVVEFFREIWLELGLADPVSIKQRSGKTNLKVQRTLEVSFDGKYGCDFTRGYISGLMSTITGIPQHCLELKCVSKGDKMCEFVLEENPGK